MKCTPEGINLELTTKCPLRCPQCYCTLTEHKDMDLQVAFHWIQEAKKNHLSNLVLSGGETLCYPHLIEVISEAKKASLKTSISTSGCGLNLRILSSLVEAGIDEISVSLNGSTEAINAISREGYNYAVDAIKLLNAYRFPATYINWVMHSNNSDDFENIITLAEHENCAGIIVLGLKPTSKNEMKSLPSTEQCQKVGNIIKNYSGKLTIAVEPCFSQMRAYVGELSAYNNVNNGIHRGCRAAVSLISVNIDGTLAPCRHLFFSEKYDTIEDYFSYSHILKEINNLSSDEAETCKMCRLRRHCRSCLAINLCMYGRLTRKSDYCQFVHIFGEDTFKTIH